MLIFWFQVCHFLLLNIVIFLPLHIDNREKFFLKTLNCPTEPGPLVQLGCGTISGALGATCVYPLQVIRTRYNIYVWNSFFFLGYK